MADPTVNWITKVIYVPKSYLSLISGSVYQLDVNAFHLKLRDLEDDPLGRVWQKTHNHNTEVILSGVTYARIVSILDPYTIEFEDGNYSVSCVNANHNIADVKTVNSVSLIINNSAGLVQIAEIQSSAYGGAVAIDANAGVESSIYPAGTHKTPCKFISDGLIVAAREGIETFDIHGSLTLTTGDDVSGYAFFGENSIETHLTIESGANVTGCQFSSMVIESSVFDGYTYLKNCSVANISGFYGYMDGCVLSYNIELISTENTFIIDCKSGCVGLSAEVPILKFGNGERHLAIRNWSGPVKFAEASHIDSTSCCDVVSGATVVIDSSVTGGEIIVRGSARILHTQTGTESIVHQTTEVGVWETDTARAQVAGSIGESLNVVGKLLKNKTETNPVTGIMTVYDDNGVDVLFTCNIWENVAGTDPYQGNAVNRRDKLA